MIFCNPSNPTGAVAGKKDLEEMVAVLQVHPLHHYYTAPI